MKNNPVLTKGSHPSFDDGVCARELLHYMVTGVHADATPPCLTACCSILPGLNDAAWRDDKHRTAVLLPYLSRLAECKRDKEADQIRAFRLADIAVREIAAEALDRAGVSHNLRSLPEVVDQTTAGASAWVAREAALAATRAAAGASAIEKNSIRLLDAIVAPVNPVRCARE